MLISGDRAQNMHRTHSIFGYNFILIWNNLADTFSTRNNKHYLSFIPEFYLTTSVNSGFSSFATVTYTFAEALEPSIDLELTVKRYSVVSPTVRLPALTGVPIGMG